jgi:hypothetical protein
MEEEKTIKPLRDFREALDQVSSRRYGEDSEIDQLTDLAFELLTALNSPRDWPRR